MTLVDQSVGGEIDRHRISLEGVVVAGRRRPLLTCHELTATSGTALLAVGEPGHGHTALALVLSGRLAQNSGSVLLDGRPDAPGLRRAVAVVDVPGVSEPDDVLQVRTVVAEELSLAKRHARRGAVEIWLEARRAGQYSSTRLEDLPGDVRVRLLTELASLRPGVGFLVVTAPDRHGGPPHRWWQQCQRLARRGFGIVVSCTPTSAAALQIRGVALINPPDELATTGGEEQP